MEEPFQFDMTRRRILTKKAVKPAPDGKCVVYWMSRDQRAQDNWALLYAHYLAAERGGLPVVVCFSLVPKFLEATIRMYGFMLRGLKETEGNLRAKNIPFHLLQGWPEDTLPAFIKSLNPAAVVCDMSPLKVPMQWVTSVAGKLDAVGTGVPMYQVDAHNVVPVWEASPKQETAARTIRPKITKLLGRYLTAFPELPANAEGNCKLPPATDWDDVIAGLEVDRSVKEVEWATPGQTGGMAVLEDFVANRLKKFDTQRNDPNVHACSNMSPYTHFGQVSAHAVALYVKKHGKSHGASVANYIEESIIRRELSDNFCFYNANHDSIKGAAQWAQDSLELHSKDKREYVYSEAQLEGAKTHDKLWNASQLQMVQEGKMHGFLRMYWAKKILEWTESPSEALRIAIYLNNKYELDGRDPNGYVGCMWSICGTHDMGWKEREVFGKIRFMNYKGCLRKFKVAQFEARYVGSASKGNEPRQGTLTSMLKAGNAHPLKKAKTGASASIKKEPAKSTAKKAGNSFAKLFSERKPKGGSASKKKIKNEGLATRSGGGGGSSGSNQKRKRAA